MNSWATTLLFSETFDGMKVPFAKKHLRRASGPALTLYFECREAAPDTADPTPYRRTSGRSPGTNRSDGIGPRI